MLVLDKPALEFPETLGGGLKLLFHWVLLVLADGKFFQSAILGRFVVFEARLCEVLVPQAHLLSPLVDGFLFRARGCGRYTAVGVAAKRDFGRLRCRGMTQWVVFPLSSHINCEIRL